MKIAVPGTVELDQLEDVPQSLLVVPVQVDWALVAVETAANKVLPRRRERRKRVGFMVDGKLFVKG